MVLQKQTHLHPIENVKALDSKLRHFLQNPDIVISKYIHPEMNVLDLGCGTGYFTTAIAKLLNNSGKVVAADVQREMLEILIKKIEKSNYKQRVVIHQCGEIQLGLNEKFDFILAFYSFHEMKYLNNVINEIQQIIKPRAKILISEQKFHVPKSRFNSYVEKMQINGFKIIERPHVFLSRTVLMESEK